jgi:hypothetical protein
MTAGIYSQCSREAVKSCTFTVHGYLRAQNGICSAAAKNPANFFPHPDPRRSREAVAQGIADAECHAIGAPEHPNWTNPSEFSGTATGRLYAELPLTGVRPNQGQSFVWMPWFVPREPLSLITLSPPEKI